MQLMRAGVRERLAAGHVVTGVIVFTSSPHFSTSAPAASYCRTQRAPLIGNRLDADYGWRIVQRGVRMLVPGTDADLFVNSVTPFARLKEGAAP